MCCIVAASSSLDSSIRIWDLEAGKQRKTIDAGPGRFTLVNILRKINLKKNTHILLHIR